MKNNSSRRNFIKTTGQGLIAIPVANSLNGLIIGSNKTPEKRKDVSTIVTPKGKLNVRDFGALGD